MQSEGRSICIHKISRFFLRLYDANFPKRKIELKYNNRKPWLSEGLKNSIKTKNKLYVKYVKIRSVYNEINYKTFRNKLKHILHIAEKKHYTDTLEANKNNMKKTWTILKGVMNSNKLNKFRKKLNCKITLKQKIKLQ